MLLGLQVLCFLQGALLRADYFMKGFNYRFESLNVAEEPNELNKAFSTLFHATNAIQFIQILQGFIPVFRMIVSRSITC